MSSFLFGQLSKSSAQPQLPSNLRVVDVQTLQEARDAVENGNGTLNVEQQSNLVGALTVAANTTPPSPEKSKMDLLLEGLLGIIPLEGLAVWVIATEMFSKIDPAAATGSEKAATITVSDPGAIQLAIVLAMIVAAISFFVGRRTTNADAKPLPAAVVILPTAAVFLWAYIANPSVLRTAMGHQVPDERWIAAVAAGVVVLLIAGALGLSKSQSGAPPEKALPNPA